MSVNIWKLWGIIYMPGDKDEASMTKRSIPPPKKGKESDVKKSLLKNKRPQNLELLICERPGRRGCR